MLSEKGREAIKILGTSMMVPFTRLHLRIREDLFQAWVYCTVYLTALRLWHDLKQTAMLSLEPDNHGPLRSWY